MQAWTARPLLGVYAAIFIDAIYVKVRDGQVGNQPFYAAIGVDLNGHRDVLGLWAGQGGGESAKFWMSVLTDLRNRGVRDVFFVVCDGLKGLPDAVNAVFPQAIVQACVIHLIRATPAVRVPEVLGPDRARSAGDLHRAHRPGRVGGVRGARREVGQGLPGHRPVVAGSIGRVHAVPRLRRRDQASSVLHQRDREPQGPLPADGDHARSLPDRAVRAQVPVPGDPRAGPQGHLTGTMGHPVEAGTQRFRRHLRRPHAGRGDTLK